jgi:hypothetical protein
MHDAAVRHVISDGIVLGDAVVPHCQRVELPAQADVVIECIHMVAELSHQTVALARYYAPDLIGEGLVGEQTRIF